MRRLPSAGKVAKRLFSKGCFGLTKCHDKHDINRYYFATDVHFAKFDIAEIFSWFALLELAKRVPFNAKLATRKDHVMDGMSVMFVQGIVIPNLLSAQKH